MEDEIKLWAIEDSSSNVENLRPTDRLEKESFLEDVLVNDPHMLMPGLTLVGRQTQTEGGYLDLLGVDENGKLVVFELKREKLTRKAVAQAIDYCSFLESLEEPELATHISERSESSGIAKIEDFEEWYSERYPNNELTELKPVRMVLVGLGVDTVAQRMVEFLAKSGVDISLLTFHGYQFGDRTLLARQAQEGEARDASSKSKQQRYAERRRRHAELTERLGIVELWKDVVQELSVADHEHVRKSGFTFYMNSIKIDDGSYSGSHSVVIEEDSGKIRLTFYPAAVHLCHNEFKKVEQTIPFESRKPPNAPPTNTVLNEWYCLLDDKNWPKHKGTLAALASAVTDAWSRKRTEARMRRREVAS